MCTAYVCGSATSYVTYGRFQYRVYITSDDVVINEWRIESDSERSDRGQVEVLSRYFPGETRKVAMNSSHYSLYSSRDSKWAPPESKNKALPTPTCCVERFPGL
jgi:hypothetical protein